MEDITTAFFKNCALLDRGELIHHNDFLLSQAMTAIEVMDEKMDCGVAKGRPVLDVNSSIENGSLPLKDIPLVEILGCMDETLAAVVNWMEGDMLSQTVYTNMYMHCIARIEDKCLRAFCEAVNKCVNLLRNILDTVNVYRDEDFNNSVQGLPLDRCEVRESQVMDMLKKVDSELSKPVKSISGDSAATSQQPAELTQALLARIRFTEFFLGFLHSIHRYLLCEKEYRFTNVKQDVHKYLDLLQKVLPVLVDTSEMGVPATGKHDPMNLAYGVLGFEPYLNVALLPPAVTKMTKIMERKDAFVYYDKMLKRMRMVLKVWSLDSRTHLARQLSFVQVYGRHGLAGQTCLLSRCILYLAFIHPATHLILGSATFHKKDLYMGLLHQFYLHGEPWHQIDTLMQQPSELSRCLSAFSERISSHLIHLQHLYSYNRSRQHDLLPNYIHASWLFYDEALKIDVTVHTALKEQCHLEEKQLPTIHFHSSYMLYFLYQLMWDYVQCGFDLGLYSLHELPGIYYCVWEMLFFPFENHLKDVHTYLRSQITTGSTKKGRRPEPKKHVNQISLDDVSSLHERVRVYYLLSRATVCALAAFSLDSKFEKPRLPFGSYEDRFLNRLSPLLNTGMHEPRDIFMRSEAFWDQLHGVGAHGCDCHSDSCHESKTDEDHLQQALGMALKSYDMARTCLTENQANSRGKTQQSGGASSGALPDILNMTAPFTEEERQQLCLLSKSNSVVCSLLKNGHKRGSATKLSLDWQPTLFFPRFRLS